MTDVKKSALAFIESRQDEILNISHRVWELAELSLKEHKTAELYVETLKKEGFEVEENLCDISTAFSGKWGKGRPYIGILGEFDALSGLSQKACCTEPQPLVKNGSGHGCGHNMLGAASFGAALGVKKYLEETGTPGTVFFYGCPGEEGGASKALMAREGVWKELDCAYCWHPGDTNEVTVGTCNSTVQYMYNFHGIASHAAGDPEHGRSALDAVELMNVGVQFLREHMPTEARIHYSILNAGGPSPNVVQPEASVLYMIRSPKVKDVLKLKERVDKIAEGAALMTETTLDRIFVDGCCTTNPNMVLGRVLYNNLCEIGVPEYTKAELEYASALKATWEDYGEMPGIGSRHSAEYAKIAAGLSENGKKVINNFVLPVYEGDHFSPGSTDVGDVSMLTPTAQFDAVTWPSGSPGHSWQNVSCGASSIGDKGVMYAAKVLCASAIDLFEDGSVIEEAKAEFKESAAKEGYDCPVPQGAKLYVIE